MTIAFRDAARVMGHVDRTGDHWLWTAYTSHKGYGAMGLGRKVIAVHRFAYQLFVGPIPNGLEIDHICNVRNCVKPDHLRAVTHYENVHRVKGRKTHCPHGHAYTPENTRVYKTDRFCRTCDRDRRKVA